MAQSQKTNSSSVSGLEPLSYLNQNQPSNVLFIRMGRAPATTDRRYKFGTIWLDTATSNVYCLVNVAANSATWALMSAGTSQVDTLTGDTGGAISPSGGNINILGGDNLTVAGSGSTLTINLDSDAYPITPYVVGPSGDAGYSTVQAALDAANGAGGGVVYIQPGTYTEDLTLYDNVSVRGLVFDEVTITGTHTPPSSGSVTFQDITLSSATDVFSSAVAGSASIFVTYSIVNVTNGYLFNLVNWTGLLHCSYSTVSGTNDGWVNNTGGATIEALSSDVGAGTGNSFNATGGTVIIEDTAVQCPGTFGGAATVTVFGSLIDEGVTFSGSSSATINKTLIDSGSNAAITQSSTGTISLGTVTINSTNNPAIDGAGTGAITLGTVTFLNNSALAATLTLTTSTNLKSGAFDTAVAAAGVTLSGTTLAADGTDANIPITVTPKGTGDLLVTVGDINASAGDIIASRSSASGEVTVECTNSDNTAADSDAFFEVAVGGTSGGNPGVRYQISGGQAYSMGIDNASADDDLLICGDNDIGTDILMTIAGAGDVTVNQGNLILGAVATQLQMNGGAVTDFIGTATLAAGTITIANTNIAANDRIFIQRQSINASTALGQLTYSISAATSFTITSVQASSPGMTETNDTSIVMYWIVREN